jgi:SAM-dependent methyltransferase
MTSLAQLDTVETWDDDVEILSAAIKDLDGPLDILEAGCGREWPLDLAGVDYRLTGIDLDADALSSRVEIVGDLDEAIIGDLSEKGAIPESAYDVIYNSFVLEHIREAEAALANMVAGLKPGGILLLRFPDRNSVFGWTTRRTPFAVHVAYYRYFLRMEGAGKPGHAPYHTYHAPIVSRDGIRDFCAAHGCSILTERGHTYYASGTDLRARVTRFYAKVVSAVSFGALRWQHNNLTYVIRKSSDR